MASESDPDIAPRARGRPPSRRPLQHAALLDVAARQINAGGAASLSLAAIGAEVGLSRNSLYYYCRDGADLAAQCFVRTCDRIAEDLEAALALDAPADQRIARVVDRLLSFDRPPIAVLNDVAFLAPEQRRDIHKRSSRNVAALAALVREGRDEGVFRAVDSELAAQSLLGLASWAIVSLPWLGRRDGPKARAQAINAIASFLFDGIAAQGQPAPVVNLRVEALRARSANLFDRREAAAVRSEQLLAAASKLFNRRGLDGVTLDDVGAEVGATKGVLYQHVSDKPDLIAQCYDRAFDIFGLVMETAIREGANGLERAALTFHLNVQAQAGPVSPLSPQPAMPHLGEAKRLELQKRSRRLKATSIRTLRNGVRDGSCRIDELSMNSELSAGLFLWLPKWLPEDTDSIAVADAITNLALFGLRTRSSP